MSVHTSVRHRLVRAVAALLLSTALPATVLAQAPETAAMTIHGDQPGAHVNRQIFAQFAEHLGHGIYGGIWVGKGSAIPNIGGYRIDVLDALRELKVPVVRWPGGCFADEYHWRDGIGKASARKVRINTHWGGVTEPNSFGTHEYMGFMDLLGAQAYVAGNVGDADPSEMAEWVEYMTSPTGSTLAKERAANGHAAPWKVPYFGVGNELWGCGGNMRPEYAADLTKRYATFVKAPADQKIMKIGSGPNIDDYHWTEVMMREAGKQIDGLSLHYYTFPGSWEHKGPATGFAEHEWASTLAHTLKMDDLLTQHSAIMDKYDPEKRVWLIVDEWGTWYDVEPGTNPGFLFQQNSLRDALVAAINLNIFVHHADRVKMTAIAQMVNVLQAMLLTDGKKMVRTPTYWVFDLYKPWQDATALPIELTSAFYDKDEFAMPAVSASAVRDTAGQVHVGLANLDPHNPQTVTTKLAGLAASQVTGKIITAPAMDTVNTFDRPNGVVPAAFAGAQIAGDTLTVTLPPKSVVVLDLR